uniref:phosphatidylinositol-3,5-bisphosphate 3-phosphatase n=1 Tax=Xenopsylla cheopis TaxID=163159 RepID=A0A6M2DVL6_XENCH
MEGEHPSLCVVSAKELFPIGTVSLEEPELQIPFTPLYGESVRNVGRTQDGLITLSNYRVHISEKTYKGSEERSLPLGLIDLVEVRDMFQLIVYCKDARVIKCSFDSNEQCADWHRRITSAINPPTNLEGYFAFPFHAWVAHAIRQQKQYGDQQFSDVEVQQTYQNDGLNDWLPMLKRASGLSHDDFQDEVDRLQFDLRGAWRISKANSDHLLCHSYPRQLLVPACISDDTLETVAKFRSSRRIPAVVWRHRGNGAVIARCSQPEVGWLGWRSSEDEELMKAVADACAFDHGHWINSNNQIRENAANSAGSNHINGDVTPYTNGVTYDENNPKSVTPPPSSPDISHVEGLQQVSIQQVKKVLIVDARSYTSAVTNRARGGGCECPEYYNAEIQFMSLGNIHVIRKSFMALRNLCAMPADCANWLTLLERTHWLQHLSGLMRASLTVVKAVHNAGRPVLVHCSDGWDRTPQIVATAQLCLDPYYRTREGFRTLVEREWLSFGHKFADRGGHQPGSIPDMNERCPVFLQWLDVVHQLVRQFPCSFEFSMPYLIKLAQHSHSCLFGTFLCNSDRERSKYSIYERTFSVWAFLANPAFRNHLYTGQRESVLWPQHNVRDLVLWAEVYLSGQDGCRSVPSMNQALDLDVETGLMTKTRSYGDLLTAGTSTVLQTPSVRRSSDPSVSLDTIKMSDITLNDESIDGSEKCESESDSYVLSSNEASNFIDIQSQYDCTNTFKTDDQSSNNMVIDNRSKNLGNETSTHTETNFNIEYNNCINDITKVPNGRTTVNNIDLSIDKCDTDIQDNICNSKRCDNYDYSSTVENIDQGDLSLNNEECKNCDENEVCSSFISPKMCFPSIESSTDTLVPSQQFTCDTGQNAIQNYISLEKNSNVKEDDDVLLSRAGQLRKSKKIDCPGVHKGAQIQNTTPLSISPTIETTPMCSASAIEKVDGLCHGISEEGLRLQQLMYEHKLREEALKRELNGTRQALLKQECQRCHGLRLADLNVLQFGEENRPEETNSLTDSVCASAASDCSWEAVEERVATIHGISNSSSVLWVPDHAVSRCTGCDGQFWIGRRKHHCRSCGCIFCADCAENFAPLPTENLYNPVRLCNPCYRKQAKLPEACKHEASDNRTTYCSRQLGAPMN